MVTVYLIMTDLIIIIVSILTNSSGSATSWRVKCEADELLVADGIDTMRSPPVCKKRDEVLKDYKTKCDDGVLGACERLWAFNFGTNEEDKWRKKFFELAEKKCMERNAWACLEVWRVIGNTTDHERKSKNKQRNPRLRFRTKEDSEKMTKFIKLACKYGNETGHPQTEYMCSMATDERTKWN